MSLQMIHARTPDQPALGGTVLSVEPQDETTSTAMDSDRAIYYQGNMIDAADAVMNGALDRGELKLPVRTVLSLMMTTSVHIMLTMDCFRRRFILRWSQLLGSRSVAK
jgi:hypothetical protein